MSAFEEREKGFENKFAHEAEIAFKTKARMYKLLGYWAAEKLGIMEAPKREDYALAVLKADFDDLQHAHHEEVITKILHDFQAARLTLKKEDIVQELHKLEPIAHAQIISE